MRRHSLAGFCAPLAGVCAALALPDTASGVLAVFVFVWVSFWVFVLWWTVFR